MMHIENGAISHGARLLADAVNKGYDRVKASRTITRADMEAIETRRAAAEKLHTQEAPVRSDKWETIFQIIFIVAALAVVVWAVARNGAVGDGHYTEEVVDTAADVARRVAGDGAVGDD